MTINYNATRLTLGLCILKYFQWKIIFLIVRMHVLFNFLTFKSVSFHNPEVHKFKGCEGIC